MGDNVKIDTINRNQMIITDIDRKTSDGIVLSKQE